MTANQVQGPAIHVQGLEKFRANFKEGKDQGAARRRTSYGDTEKGKP